MRVFNLVTGLGLIGRLVSATPRPFGTLDGQPHALSSRQQEGVSAAAPKSCNTPCNRACWLPGFDINTDYEAHTPDTGVTRRYHLEITEYDEWVAGDGLVKQSAMLVNGQFPGPTIWADWGDWVEVTVVNKLKINGTSIHWHGIRFLNNNINDGANGITECPIPPGMSKVYRFRVEQYGTSWYHSHFSSQYGNGVVGSMVFNGPASLPYHEDLGVFPVSDWYWRPADVLQWEMIPEPGEDPNSDNILFNGTHVNPKDGGGEYYRVKLKPGKKHRLRIINPSVDNPLTVSLVNHNFTVIQTDFVPVRPYTTESIYLNVGQRYDVIIHANQPVDNYWFNVTMAANGLCGETDMPYPAAIFQYENASSTALPTIKGNPPTEYNCQDYTKYEPIVAKDVPRSLFSATPQNTLVSNVTLKEWGNTGVQRIYWEVNGVDFNITWDEPTLEYLLKGNLNFPRSYNTLIVPERNTWSFWILENPTPMPHPMHLHGHDLYILGHNVPQTDPLNSPILHFNESADMGLLNFKNPTRRDTVTLPANGWVVVAFQTDNPGAWLFHCHIAWHASEGLSVQVVERAQDIPNTFDLNGIEPICEKWTKYYATSPAKQWDSGV